MTDDEVKRCGSALAKYAEDNAAWWDKIPDYEARTLRKFWQSAWAAATAPRPAPEGTIPVRIPVAVDSEGRWAVGGDSRDTDKERMSLSISGLDVLNGLRGGEVVRVTIVTAHVPLPAPPVDVEGSVE